ncbi:MAG: iron-containing alcohol dehydrogenase [Opitutaceae bacterium]|nr:iron-containing alcohol dehydrogenase [Opitutaceae bacterium]
MSISSPFAASRTAPPQVPDRTRSPSAQSKASTVSLATIRTLTLLQPERIVFGSGCALECAAEIQRLGLRRVLLVTNPPIVPLAQPLVDRLRTEGATVTIVTDVPAEPGVAAFAARLADADALDLDAVIGFGGGSVLDIAKLLAAYHRTGWKVREHFGIGLLPGRSLKLFCLPTTAGTGSEVSPNAILLDEAEQLKKGVVSPWLLADGAFVDPALTLTVPPGLTAATGIDALTHCIEAYANKFAHPIVDLYALEGVRLIGAHIARAVADGRDLEARSAVALGSLYGGLCLGPVNTAAVHALAYPLGGEFHIPHGLSNALLLPHVLRFNLPAAPERYAAIARALGVPAGGSDAATAARGIDRLAQLCAKCGLPAGLRAAGIPADALPRLAVAAMKVTRLLKNNPRDLTAADAEAIYRAAW